jgi:hypothetical protein
MNLRETLNMLHNVLRKKYYLHFLLMSLRANPSHTAKVVQLAVALTLSS